MAAPVAADSVTFDANSGTAATVTITTNVSVTAITINKSDLTLTTNGTATLNTSGNMTLTTGVINTNGSGCSWSALSSSTTTARTLTLGASLLTLTAGGTSFNVANNTAFTLNAGSSTITLSGAGAILNCGNGGGFAVKTFNNVVFSGSGAANLSGITGTIYNNVTRTGTAVKTDSFIIQNNQTINGTLTLTGNSVTNRPLIQSVTVGSAKTLTAASVAFTNVDFQDITMSNSTSPGTNFTGTSLGDCLGNAGITFDTPVSQTWNGNTAGSWSTAANWTSRVPLPQDNVSINGLTSSTLGLDMPRLGASIDFTGSTGGTLNVSSTLNTCYGSLTLVPGLIWSGSQQFTFAGRASYSFTSASTSIGSALNITAPGGTLTNADGLTMTGNWVLNNGTWDTNSQALSVGQVQSTNGNVRSMLLRNANITITGTAANAWNTQSVTNLTFNAGTSNISITGNNTGFLTGNGLTFNNVSISSATTGANSNIQGNSTFNQLSLSGGSTALLPYKVTGSNTITTFALTAGQFVTLTAGTTQTVTNYASSGSAGSLITLNTTSTAATLAFGSRVNVDYLSLTNIVAATTIPAYAGTHSTDGGGNTNWLFTAAPASGTSSNLMMMGVG